LETSGGVDRITLAFLMDAYESKNSKAEKKERFCTCTRIWLCKAAVIRSPEQTRDG